MRHASQKGYRPSVLRHGRARIVIEGAPHAVEDSMDSPTLVRSRLNGKVVHPGRILEAEWMRAFDLSQNELARMMKCSARRVNEIVNGRRAITADSALRLSACLGFAPHYWLHLQADYEIERAMRRSCEEDIDESKEPVPGAAIVNLVRARHPPGWRRATTPEYRAAKRKEAILSYIDRVEFLESIECDNLGRAPPAD
jgi:addiction module HigA family antidote